jgi:hypothetical protein
LNPSGSGLEIVTEETQRGRLPRLVAPMMRPAMLRQHQRWIDQLARLAESGERPPSAE